MIDLPVNWEGAEALGIRVRTCRTIGMCFQDRDEAGNPSRRWISERFLDRQPEPFEEARFAKEGPLRAFIALKENWSGLGRKPAQGQ